jgi:hypothetical protein
MASLRSLTAHRPCEPLLFLVLQETSAISDRRAIAICRIKARVVERGVDSTTKFLDCRSQCHLSLLFLLDTIWRNRPWRSIESKEFPPRQPDVVLLRTKETLTGEANRLTWPSHRISPAIASCSAASAARNEFVTIQRWGIPHTARCRDHICRSGDQRPPSAAAAAHTSHPPKGILRPDRPSQERLSLRHPTKT